MTVQPEILRYLGFAEETVRGVAETSAEMHCDAKSLSPGFPDNPEMTFEGSMGRGKNVHRPGSFILSPAAEVGTDIKILARQLYFALGGLITDVTEGDGTGINPSKVYYYDASGDSFTSKLTAFTNSTANDVTVPGHAAAEVDDYLAIGYSKPFTKVTINVGTAKTDTSTIVWEYWDGDAWVTLTVTDATTGFTVASEHTVTFTAPTDWAVKSLSNTAATYYIRARCSAFTSAGTAGAITQGSIETQPDISTQYIYSDDKVLLPSQTLFMGMDIKEYILSGCVTDKLELTADNEFVMLKIDTKGQTPTSDTLKGVDDLSINEDYPLAYYEVDLHMRTLGSTTTWGAETIISQDTKKLNFSVANNISDSDGMRIGSRFAGYLPAGERALELGFDYLYINEDMLELLWGSTGGPTEESGSTEVEFMVEINAGIYGSAQIWFPRAILTSAGLDSSGRDAIVQGVKVEAYQTNITIPSDPTESVNTDCLVTIVTNFTDSSGSFDGPAGFAATP